MPMHASVSRLYTGQRFYSARHRQAALDAVPIVRRQGLKTCFRFEARAGTAHPEPARNPGKSASSYILRGSTKSVSQLSAPLCQRRAARGLKGISLRQLPTAMIFLHAIAVVKAFFASQEEHGEGTDLPVFTGAIPVKVGLVRSPRSSGTEGQKREQHHGPSRQLSHDDVSIPPESCSAGWAVSSSSCSGFGCTRPRPSFSFCYASF